MTSAETYPAISLALNTQRVYQCFGLKEMLCLCLMSGLLCGRAYAFCPRRTLGVLEILYRIVVVIKSIMWHKVCLNSLLT